MDLTAFRMAPRVDLRRLVGLCGGANWALIESQNSLGSAFNPLVSGKDEDSCSRSERGSGGLFCEADVEDVDVVDPVADSGSGQGMFKSENSARNRWMKVGIWGSCVAVASSRAAASQAS